MTIKDSAELLIETDEAGKKLFEKNKDLVCKATLLRSVSFSTDPSGDDVDVCDGLNFKIKILK